MDTKKIAAALDVIADSLEAKGFQKEAKEIDVIANTVEAALDPWGTIPKDKMPNTFGNLSGKSVKQLEDMQKDLAEEQRELNMVVKDSQVGSVEKNKAKGRLEAIKDEFRRLEDELRNKADS